MDEPTAGRLPEDDDAGSLEAHEIGAREIGAHAGEAPEVGAAPAAVVERPSQGSRVAGVLRIIAVIAAIGVLVVLTLQNTEPVSLRLFAWTVTLSRALLVFALIVIGVVLGWLLRSMRDDDGLRLLG